MVDHRAGNSFLKLPKHPDFPRCIQAPLSLELLKARIREGSIKTDADLHRDLLLLFANAALFHPEGSTAHENALDMFDFANGEMRKMISIAKKHHTHAA